MTRVKHLVFSALVLASCTAEEPTQVPPTAPSPVPVNETTSPTMPDEHPDLDSLEILSRGPRRLSVEQLERAIESIGALPEGSVQLPANLSRTLGEPDYFRVTEEGLDPTPLFMKFMTDLGGFACFALSDLDPNRPQDERVLTRYTDTEENIRYMILRFTGIDGAAADEYVPRLTQVYEGGRQASSRPNGGWEAVCLALFTSPEFLLY